jgi:cell division protein FtsQ
MSVTSESAPSERLSTDPRMSRRRRAVERSRRRRVLRRCSVVVFVAVMVWAALWSPLFTVRAVRVRGGRHTSASAVSAVTGLDRGPNLLLLSPSEVASAVRTLPWVRRVRVLRTLPGTVKVRLTERRPALVLAAPGGSWTLDARGRVLARGAASARLPQLVCDEVADPRPGVRIEDDAPRAALRAYRSLGGRLRRSVQSVLAPSVERISFALADGVTVRFGAAERLAAKNAVLGALLERLRGAATLPGYIDVQVPESPATSPLAPEGLSTPSTTTTLPSGGR